MVLPTSSFSSTFQICQYKPLTLWLDFDSAWDWTMYNSTCQWIISIEYLLAVPTQILINGASWVVLVFFFFENLFKLQIFSLLFLYKMLWVYWFEKIFINSKKSEFFETQLKPGLFDMHSFYFFFTFFSSFSKHQIVAI